MRFLARRRSTSDETQHPSVQRALGPRQGGEARLFQVLGQVVERGSHPGLVVLGGDPVPDVAGRDIDTHAAVGRLELLRHGHGARERRIVRDEVDHLDTRRAGSSSTNCASTTSRPTPGFRCRPRPRRRSAPADTTADTRVEPLELPAGHGCGLQPCDELVRIDQRSVRRLRRGVDDTRRSAHASHATNVGSPESGSTSYGVATL